MKKGGVGRLFLISSICDEGIPLPDAGRDGVIPDDPIPGSEHRLKRIALQILQNAENLSR